MLSVNAEAADYGTNFITVTAPADAAIHVGFYDANGCYFDGAAVPARETRMVAVHGSYFRVAVMPEVT